MKTKLLLLFAVTTVAVASVGCSEDLDDLNVYEVEQTDPTPVLEGFNKLIVSVPEAVTLTETTQFTFEWEAEDTFAVYEKDGAWVADLEIRDADAEFKTFAVSGDTRLDDDTDYIAVYPALDSQSASTYEKYKEAIEAATSAAQEQDGATCDHLKSNSRMEVAFKSDDPITFSYLSAFVAINLQVEVGQTPSSLKFVDGDNSYTINFSNFEAAVTDEDVYTAYMSVNPTSASRKQEFFIPADATTATRTIENFSDLYVASNGYTMNTYTTEIYEELFVTMPEVAGFDSGKFAWTSDARVSLYNKSTGAWAADCKIANTSSSLFSIEDGVTISNKNSYIAVFPAKEGSFQETYDDYKSAADKKTSAQSQNGDNNSDHLNDVCWFSGEFKGGESSTLSLQNAILTLAFEMSETTDTPNSIEFTDGSDSYSVSFSGLSGATSYSAYMAVLPKEATSRNQSLSIVYNGGDVKKYTTTAYSTAYDAGAITSISTADMDSVGILEISTTDQLIDYLEDPTVDAMLIENIDLSGKSYTLSTLTAEFNGNGKSINNLSIVSTANNAGLFTTLAAGASIKNLTMVNPTISGAEFAGAIVGEVSAGASVTNCTVTGGAIDAYTGKAGGVIGHNKGVVTGCSFEGTVSSNLSGTTKNVAGGVVGIATKVDGYDCIISNCVANADVEANQYAGGIVGRTLTNTVTITGCIFESGTVTATSSTAGGIVGDSYNGLTIGCVNYGTVISVSKVGGIAGAYSNGGTITACYSKGVIGEASTTTGSVGGIIGQLNYTIDINGCYDMSEYGTQPNNGNIGQITGNVAANAVLTINDCYFVKHETTTGNSKYGELCDDIAALNAKVDDMNTAINATDNRSFNFVAGTDDTPTLIEKQSINLKMSAIAHHVSSVVADILIT